ncbi:DUF2851 family protein [Flavobacterium amniphilum]|uniref:DUF2851 family protein n=1 Tax=Flavobacterium amniphilum TaxID=1834035 RepID=UPI002029BEE8|nr:DUF2851 family protein [Flavobacterium amniphilum]MCL9807337.1 DUF2851 family protein [Flavobacterium amniphilum]
MKEDFLHYVWQYKKFAFSGLRTVQGELLQILDTGNSLRQSGPDFFNARIILDDQKWAGNVEIHLKSSDWYLHHHERDQHYDNVILHVVWKHDAGVFRKDNSEIPVLEICHFVSPDLIRDYQKLQARKSWVNCENEIKTIPQFLMQNWNERLFFERLERKVEPINALLKESNNDWEATFFCLLAKNFGLNVNGEPFYRIACSIPFSVIRKESFDVQYLEALFFGQAGFLTSESQDNYVKELKDLHDYLSIKYQLEKNVHPPIEFFRLRPDNFPTIRLGQLAMLYHRHRNLFSKIITIKTLPEFYALFDVSVSSYWELHYNFEKSSKLKDKTLSKSFVDLLIINTVIPFKFAYDLFLGKDISEEHINILQKIAPESNSIINKFKEFGIEAVNAFETQSLLQLKNVYCDKNRCLECAVGIELLKN